MGINKKQKNKNEKAFLDQIGMELGIARRHKHFTQKKVASIIGCSLSHINDIENGNANTTAYELVTLCKLYKISPMHILGLYTFQYDGLDQLPQDEQELLLTLYRKLIYSHKTSFQKKRRTNTITDNYEDNR